MKTQNSKTYSLYINRKAKKTKTDNTALYLAGAVVLGIAAVCGILNELGLIS